MRIILLFVILSLIGGCAAYKPKPVSPEESLSAFEGRILNSPGLKEFMEKNLGHEILPWPPEEWDFALLTLAAFYYHPDMDVARAGADVAEAGTITAGAIPNPSIGFTPQYNASAVSGVSPWTLGFSLDIPVETAGKRGYRVTRARQLSEAASLKIGGAAWQVRSRLRKGLLDLYAARQLEVLFRQEEKIRQDLVRLMEERYAAGEVSQPDVSEAHISLDRTRLSLREAQKRMAEVWVQTAGALGLTADALQGVKISFAFSDLLLQELPSRKILRSALLNRSDIMAALADYAAGESALSLEIAKQYPDIRLGPGYSWDAGDNKWSIGFSLAIPLFNRNQGPIAEAEARRKESEAKFIALQARILGEIDRATAGYQASLKKLETADSLLSTRQKQVDSLEAMFNAGEADRLEFFNSQLELSLAEISRLETLVGAQESMGLLEDALQRPLDEFVKEGNKR